jgi:hypothetical protein
MDTYFERITSAKEKEQLDTAQLEQKYKCKVFPFGQGQLPDEAREFLRRHMERLLIRWLPDLMVIRPDLYPIHGGEWIWLADSKAGRQDTNFWDLEKAAHEAHRLQRVALGLPIVYLWPDGYSCSYVEDLTDDVLIPGPRVSVWRTDYWLIPKDIARPLEEVFGKKKPGKEKPE